MAEMPRNGTEHDHAYERYDYLYTETEINAIAQAIRNVSANARESFVCLNNHFGAQAVTNARQLAATLGVATVPSQPSLYDASN